MLKSALNGHEITTVSNTSPETYGKFFVQTCGAATITNCPICNTPIRGFIMLKVYFH
nr:DUF2321 domain-containing protein [Clostridium acetobutylicum]